MFYRPTELSRFCSTGFGEKKKEKERKRKLNHYFAKLKVLRAMLLTIQAFWGVTSCRLISIYQSTRRNIPNHLNIQTFFYVYRNKKLDVWLVSRGAL